MSEFKFDRRRFFFSGLAGLLGGLLAGKTEAKALAFTPVGNLRSEYALANAPSSVTTYRYDPRDRLTSVTHEMPRCVTRSPGSLRD